MDSAQAAATWHCAANEETGRRNVTHPSPKPGERVGHPPPHPSPKPAKEWATRHPHPSPKPGERMGHPPPPFAKTGRKSGLPATPTLRQNRAKEWATRPG